MNGQTHMSVLQATFLLRLGGFLTDPNQHVISSIQDKSILEQKHDTLTPGVKVGRHFRSNKGENKSK